MAPGVNPTPHKLEMAEYLKKTVEIPTPKPYIFLFLVLQVIYMQYVIMALEINSILQKWEIGRIHKKKLLRSAPLNHIYSCSLCSRQYIQYISYAEMPTTPISAEFLLILTLKSALRFELIFLRFFFQLPNDKKIDLISEICIP
jgi:hypothetical protein